MKKCFYTLLLCIPVMGWAQNSRFEITGTVAGLADKSKIFLTNPDDPTDTIASTVSNKNSFVIKGTLPESKLYYLSFFPAEKKSLLFLDNNKIILKGDITKVQLFELNGSPAHTSFLQFQQKFDPYFKEYAKLSEAANKTGVNDSLLQLYKSLVNQVAEAGDEFASAHKDQNIAPFMWATIMQVVNDLPRVERSFLSMSPAVKASFYGKYLSDRINESKIGSIGSPAMEFVQADTSGKPVALSSFKGKYVLVDFWASWCGPCRKENPNLVAAHSRFRDKNFTVLGVSLDNNRDRWIKAISDDQLNWTQVSDLQYWQNEVAVKYKIQTIPQNLLIDPNGVIIGKNLRGQELQLKLCELLGCN
ncbi:TlpA disulfide reductase family protein [Flavihumibacter fluvii]|uniref:TlpA disulfide reductase family protein n=1 Tax=Flavihumibacter fluvii TaxID=2838157 RepID=UPI001BDEDD06|nr:TlpA disulfide reductase family protein [Flavihumibacter fluvii]ULQ53603.1 AhpC/TSA family protein [Flavihumibacter fluvii]